MTQTTVLNRKSLRAPPRIDTGKVSQPLQDLFASWYVSLKENFKGLGAADEIVPGLFPIRPTGVSVQPMAAAINAFLGSLDAGQRKAVSFPVESEVWRHWSNIHRNLMRHGLCLAELGEAQRELD